MANGKTMRLITEIFPLLLLTQMFLTIKLINKHFNLAI